LIELIEELEREASKNCGFCDSVCPTLPASKYKGHISARGRVILPIILDPSDQFS